MANSFIAPQVGFTPTGVNGHKSTSSIVLGRNNNVAWEAIGVGLYGRPDYMEVLKINLTDLTTTGSLLGSISLNVADIQAIILANPNAAGAGNTIQLREVDVCDAGQPKKMMVLASATYSP